MPVDYKKDQEENKEFDEAVDSVSPEGKYQKPSLKNLREGVKIRNRTGTAEELGLDSGRAMSVAAPWDYFLGGYAAKRALGTAIGTYGLDKTLEVGINALFPDAPDTLLEQFMRNKQMGLGATAIKGARLTKDKLQSTLDSVFDLRIPNPFEVGEFAAGTGTGFGPKSPRPSWRLTAGPEEKRILLNRFADEVQFSPKGVNIAKRKEAGYKFLGDFAAEWNDWSKSSQFIDELADKPATAYVEHLVGKGNRLDFFWRIPDDIRFRKGSRHSPNNVRILYSDRFKKLKDATENILYKQQATTPDMNRLVVDLDIPKMKGKSITVKQSPKDLVLKRVDGTVVGRLGDYHDVLYAPTSILKEALTTNINPRTGKFYINPNTRDMKKAIRAWRENILRDKINFIIDEAPTLKDYKTKGAKFNYQESAIREDLVNFLEEYKFIPQPKGSPLKRQLLSEPAFGLRGGKPIKPVEPEWKKKLRPPFKGVTKTAEREVQKGKLKRTLNLDDIFPDR